MKSIVTTLGILAGLNSVANAALVHVRVLGVVDYCVINGGLQTVPDGAPVSMDFNVDTNSFLNSPTFPTRGYAIDLSSFALVVGGVNCPIVNPQSPPAYFVLRNNDPAVDGFFMSSGNVEYPFPLQLRIPGLTPVHELDFSRGFNDGTPFSSLDILGELGFYGFENMASYQWTVGRFGNPGAEFAYQSIELSLVNQNVDLTGTMNLQDTGAFSANRTMNYTVMQGTSSLASGTVVASSSSTAFSIPVPDSATGAATLVFDGSSFLRKTASLSLTGSSVAVGSVNIQNGDADNSGEVDAVDIDLVIADFGSLAVGNTDVDVSGEVDAVDIDIVIANFGGIDN